MVKIPDFPDKEELEFKEKNLILSLREQAGALKKVWIYALVASLLAAIPLGFGLKSLIANNLINSYNPPEVNTALYQPEDLEIVEAKFIPVVKGVYSVYAQVLNPNAALAAWQIEYRFVLKDSSGRSTRAVPGSSYVARGESRFLVAPKVELDFPPAEVSLEFDAIRWTGRSPEIAVNFDVLQQNSGITEEGNFFVEGLVRNRQDFNLKKIQVEILVFDKSGIFIQAASSTGITDLAAFESRYFRVLWPEPPLNLDVGPIQINPSVNPLDAGAVVSEPDRIPFR